MARKSAFSMKAKEKAIVVLEDFTFEAPKTSAYSEMMSNLGFDGKKTLLVLGIQIKMYICRPEIYNTQML